MTKLLVLAGKKQSGKTSSAHFVSAYITSQIARLNDNVPLSKVFSQTDLGKIVVQTTSGNGELDFSRKDAEFSTFASQYIWPYVKIYSFADELKSVSMKVFGLTFDQCYGTNEQKNSFTKIRWGDMIKFDSLNRRHRVKKDKILEEYMTAREFLQWYGTDVCRVLADNCWIDATMRKIDEDEPDIAIIDDCRFENEAKACSKREDTKIIRLLRDLNDGDEHSSEQILKSDAANFNMNLDNSALTIKEKNEEILNALYRWKWLSEHIPL